MLRMSTRSARTLGVVALVAAQVSCGAYYGVSRPGKGLARTRSEDVTLTLWGAEERISRTLGKYLEGRQILAFEVSPGGCWMSAVLGSKFGISDPRGGNKVFLVDICRERVRSFEGRGLSWAPREDALWAIDVSGRLLVFEGDGRSSLTRRSLEGVSLVVPGNFALFGQVVPFSDRAGLVLGYPPGELEDFVSGVTRLLVCRVSEWKTVRCLGAPGGFDIQSLIRIDYEKAVAIGWGSGDNGVEGALEILGLGGAPIMEAFRAELPSESAFVKAASGGGEDILVAVVMRSGVFSPRFFKLDWATGTLERFGEGYEGCQSRFVLGAPSIEAMTSSGDGWEVLLEEAPDKGPRYFRIDVGGQIHCKRLGDE